ncbi:Pimeloyl-(acyl-carrier protein) methyl ester esterase [Gammaproteobacteria bacterium]
MSLFVRSFGVGPDLVLLHGWGFHGGIWDDLATTLAEYGQRIHVVDLPGHGHSPSPTEPLNVDNLAAAVRKVVPSGSAWMGWSLGGMVAIAAAAQYPEEVRTLVAVGASPRFVRGPDWPAAVAHELLTDFGRGLREDWRATLLRFLALQTRTVASQTVRQLRATMLALPPDPSALAMGLSVLEETDLRPRLSTITCPTLVLLGERDTLVPAAVATDLARLRPDWRIECLPGTGHLPFITHRDTVLSTLVEHLAIEEPRRHKYSVLY